MASTWTQKEDDLLRSLVSEYGAKKWAIISTQLKTKGSKQCRRRWKNYLNVELKKGGWSAEEDAVLMAGHKKCGNKWTEIAKLVGGRTDNAVKNRFAALCKRPGAPVESSGRLEERAPRKSTKRSRSSDTDADDDMDDDEDDSNEDELDVASDFKHDSSAAGGHFDSAAGMTAAAAGAGGRDHKAGSGTQSPAIPSSAVASATAAVQAAIAAFTSQRSSSLGNENGSLGQGPPMSLPSPSMLMSMLLPSPNPYGSLGHSSPVRSGNLHQPQLASGPLGPGALPVTQLPIMQLKLELPTYSSFASDSLSPSSLASLSSMDPPSGLVHRRAAADSAEYCAAKRSPVIAPSAWQQHFQGQPSIMGLSSPVQCIPDMQYNSDMHGHQQGQYSQEVMLVHTAISSTPRTPCTPNMMATAQEAAARQVATARALASISGADIEGCAGSSNATASWAEGFAASPSKTQAQQQQQQQQLHWSTVLSQGCQKRAYKKPGGLSIDIPDAGGAVVVQSGLAPSNGLAIRVYKDLLTPCEVQYARELNEMDIPIQIDLEDPPLSTSRRATMQALSALLSPTPNPATNATPKSPSELSDLLSWFMKTGSTPRPLATPGPATAKASAVASVKGASAVAGPSDADKSGSAGTVSEPREQAAGASANGVIPTATEPTTSTSCPEAGAASTEVRPLAMHSGHRQFLVKLIGGAYGGGGEEEEKAVSHGSGVIVPSPRRATAVSPSNYTFGLDSLTGVFSPTWGGHDGCLASARGSARDISITPCISPDELKTLMDAISSEDAAQPQLAL